jgi:hypothetical protein
MIGHANLTFCAPCYVKLPMVCLAVPLFCNYLVEGVIFGKISLILNVCSDILYKF